MENGEQPTNSAETDHNFLKIFTQKVEKRVKEMLLNPEMMEHFDDSLGHPRHVREGHPGHIFLRDLQLTAHAAASLKKEICAKMHGSKEDIHHAQAIDKIVTFYKAQETAFNFILNINDDAEYKGVSIVLYDEMEKIYKKYRDLFVVRLPKE